MEQSGSVHSRSLSMIEEDVLCLIFLHCLPLRPSAASLSPKEAPLLLTHVCRRWRHVAVNYPKLWQSLRLDLEKIRVTTSKDADHLMKLLQCSKATSFNLQVRWPPQSQVTGHVPQAFLFNRSICNSLTSLMLEQVIPSQLAQLPPGLFPRLETLALSINHRWRDALRHSYDAFDRAPSLRRVALNCWFFSPINWTFKISLPWEQLTHFVQTDCDMGEAKYASYAFHSLYLPRCVNLQYLSLQLGHVVDEHQVYAAPSLQGMSINFWGLREPGALYYPQILDKVAFPNLKSLRLEGEIIEEQDPNLGIDALCTKLRGFEHLTHFSLSWQYIATDILRDLVRATPNVETLDIHIAGEGSSPIFEVLEWREEDPASCVLPRLETLILRPIDDEDEENPISGPIEPDLLRSFVASRMGTRSTGCCRLRNVVLFSIGSPAYGEARAAVQDFIDGGLALEDRVYEKGKEKQEWMRDEPLLEGWWELHLSSLYPS